MDQLQTSFGQQLRQFRLRAGLSQAALAEQAGLTPAAVAALERGVRRVPYPHTLGALAKALVLSPADHAVFVAAASEWAGAQPPIVDAPSPPTNLPALRVALVGREHEVARVGELLIARQGEGSRLLSITGVGGVGKSSLALHVAHRLRSRFRDGTWLIELDRIPDQHLVERAVAEGLGLVDHSDQPLSERVCAFLASRSALLVLDNCEHVLESCARLIEAVLDRCPNVRVLTTSREPLLVRGEQQVRLAPLQTVAPNGASSADPSPDSPAAQLFVMRARSVAPDFALTPRTAEVVSRLCARLDGLPLALELAASRVRTLSPDQILARLDDIFGLLVHGGPVAPTRHQTLRAAMDWSYTSLSEPERAVFRRLAAFVGEFDLDAAEAVCSDAELDRSAVLDLLTSLADKSLVMVESVREEEASYRLLEPLRQYASRQLDASGEVADVRRRHAQWHAELAERASPELSGPNAVIWLRRLDPRLPNLRASMKWLLDQSDTAELARLALALVPYWGIRGYLAEAREWLETTLRMAPPLPRSMRLQAVFALGKLAYWQFDLEHAATMLEQARTLSVENGDAHMAANTLTWLGATRRRAGDLVEAQSLLLEGLQQHEAQGDAAGAAWAVANLGNLAQLDGRLAESVRFLEDALARYRAIGNVRYVAVTSIVLASTFVELGQPQRVPTLLREAMETLQAVGVHVWLISGLATVASVASLTAQPLRAARLLGATEAAGERFGARRPYNLNVFSQALERVQQQLKPAELEQALAEGRAMSLEAVMAEVRALAGTDHAAPSRQLTRDTTGEPLTVREQEVVRLLERGLTDRQIGAELGISRSTASVHVRNVLAKLEIHSRWQVHDRLIQQPTATR